MASAALAVLFLAVPSRHRKKTSDSQRQEATKRWNRAALFLSSYVQLGMALGNHRASTRVVSDMFGAFEFTKWLCVCTRLLSERCHVLSQASSHIMHQPPLWECPYFFLHSQPQLSALKRTRVLGNEKCCVSLKKKIIINSPQKRSDSLFFFWWQVGFPEKRPLIVVVAITWTDGRSRRISLSFCDARNIITCFVQLLIVWQGLDQCHILSKSYKKKNACLVLDMNLQTIHHKPRFWLQAWSPFRYKLVVF